METKNYPEANKLSTADKWKIAWTLLIVVFGSGALGSLAVHLTAQSI